METSINMPVGQRTNWSMILRVGVVSVLVLGLVGYAMKVTYESVILNGIVDKGDYFRVDLKTMSNFDMDERLGTVEDVAPDYRKLDGKKVLLLGQISPTGFSAGPKTDKFQICYSVATCCLSGPPKPQHFVSCRAPAGKLFNNYDSSTNVEVLGTLHIKVIKAEGRISSIFQMDVDSVKPLS